LTRWVILALRGSDGFAAPFSWGEISPHVAGEAQVRGDHPFETWLVGPPMFHVKHRAKGQACRFTIRSALLARSLGRAGSGLRCRSWPWPWPPRTCSDFQRRLLL
jgi:hypothetical protein